MLTQTGELWRSQGAVDVSMLVAQLMGTFNLSRGHAKDTPSGGKLDTYQTMLVFDTENTEYNDEQRAHNDEAEFSNEQREEVVNAFFGVGERTLGPRYKAQIMANNAIARVPDHLYLKLGLPKADSADAPMLEMEDGDLVLNHKGKSTAVTTGSIIEQVQMIRVSINIMPHHKGRIPRWLELRSRHERTASVALIGDALARM
jgi:hypothetical protein